MLLVLKIVRTILLYLTIICSIPSLLLGFCVKMADRSIVKRTSNHNKILSNKIEKIYQKFGLIKLRQAMKKITQRSVRCPQCRGKNSGTGYYSYACQLCDNRGALFRKNYK